MRLIDADALLAEYDRVHVGEPGNARKLIENAPTIEERRQGYWVKLGWSVYCSECHHEMAFVTRNFCPKCGAKMEGGKDSV